MRAMPTIARAVSLTGWTVRAKFDFISFTGLDTEQRAQLAVLLRAKGAVVKLPKISNREIITVHDPSPSSLQVVIDHYPNASLWALEVSVDFSPVGETDISELAPVFRWLADCFTPALTSATRKQYDPCSRRYQKTHIGPIEGLTTVIWEDAYERVKHRLYIKETDGNHQITKPFVRLETSFSMTGCSEQLLVSKAWHLAFYRADLRRKLSPSFHVSEGIKPRLMRNRAATDTTSARVGRINQTEADLAEKGWLTGGAMWAVKQDYRTRPNLTAHRRIGDALDRLGRTLTTLQLPENSRAVMRVVPADSIEELELPDDPQLVPIGVKYSSKSKNARKTYAYRRYIRKEEPTSRGKS